MHSQCSESFPVCAHLQLWCSLVSSSDDAREYSVGIIFEDAHVCPESAGLSPAEQKEKFGGKLCSVWNELHTKDMMVMKWLVLEVESTCRTFFVKVQC